MLAPGIRPKIAQERLGHSSIAVTMDTFSHALPNMQQDAVAKLLFVHFTACNRPIPINDGS
jgi:hypothetical protein